MSADLSTGEVDLLVDGLSDDVAFVWVLIHLGLRGDPPSDLSPPTGSVVDAAFGVLARLGAAGFVRVGRMENLDGGSPGRVAPLRHVEEPLGEVKKRVMGSCLSGVDWEWSCWAVNTSDGDDAARSHRS